VTGASVRSRKRLFVNLGLTAASLLVAVAALEAMFRYVPLQEVQRQLASYYFDVKGSIYDYGVGKINIRLKPMAVSTVVTLEYRVQYFINSLGYRDREFTLEKPADTYRIVVVGDSVTFGTGVELEETFVKGIERRLAANPPLPGKRLQVLNLGCGSYSAGQNLVLIRDEVSRLSPDLVVMVHFSNDAMEWPFYAGSQGLPDSYVVSSEYWDSLQKNTTKKEPAEPTFSPPQWLARLARRSRVAEMGLNFLESMARRSDRPTSYAVGDVYNDPFWPLRSGADLDHADAWKLTERIHVEARRVARQAGARFLLVFVPAGLQVNGFEWDEGRVAYGFPVGEVSDSAMQDRIGRAVDAAGGRSLDLTDAFRRHSSRDRRLYFPYDGHLTPYGHAVAAEPMEAAIRTLIADDG
jgi:lysophospholipase L1-like esterase